MSKNEKSSESGKNIFENIVPTMGMSNLAKRNLKDKIFKWIFFGSIVFCLLFLIFLVLEHDSYSHENQMLHH